MEDADVVYVRKVRFFTVKMWHTDFNNTNWR